MEYIIRSLQEKVADLPSLCLTVYMHILIVQCVYLCELREAIAVPNGVLF